MITAANRNGVKLAIGHMRRFYSGWGAARQLVADGAIGRPLRVGSQIRDGLLNWGTRIPNGYTPARGVLARGGAKVMVTVPSTPGNSEREGGHAGADPVADRNRRDVLVGDRPDHVARAHVGMRAASAPSSPTAHSYTDMAAASRAREEMLEAIAEHDDELMAAWVAGRDLSVDQIKYGVCAA